MRSQRELELLYKGKTLEEVYRFYDSFKGVDGLMRFVKHRPTGNAKVYEYPGDKRVITVVPSQLHNNKFAKGFRQLFKGFHIVMVESGIDPYFKYARNVNIGVERALRYSPKWIIVANDDLYRIDNPKRLRKKLLELDDQEIENVWINPAPEQHHSHYVHLVKRRWIYKVFKRLQSDFSARFQNTLDRFGADCVLLYAPFRWYYHIFFKKVKTFLCTEDFFILSGTYTAHRYASKKKIYDEIFLNGAEDAWLSLELENVRSSYIDFKIGSFIGGTHGGPNKVNDFRYGIMNSAIFYNKFKTAKIVRKTR